MSIERVIMLKLRKGKDLVLARIVSFELSKEIPEVESWFYLSKNDQYNLYSIFAVKDRNILIGGINCEVIRNKVIVDEIWVRKEYRGMWIAKDMLSLLKAECDKKERDLYYYSHLEPYKDLFINNGLNCSAYNKKRRKEESSWE
jgi:GNAT superfamily N-acetyltransferase